MKWWDDITESAMIGTSKRTTDIAGLSEALSGAIANIKGSGIDKEEEFLQIGALAFNYRQCGHQPLQKKGIEVSLAADEGSSYCSLESTQTLKDILDIESVQLLQYWMQHCHSRQHIIRPDMLPLVLDAAAKNTSLQTLTALVGGKRAQWLTEFNPLWNFANNTTDEELWQTGTPEQRRQVLHTLRESNKTLAREWLQQAWPQEDAGTKTSFLEQLQSTVNSDDIIFLESLATEKSKKVKDAALNLLKAIPESTVVAKYSDVISKTITVVKEKTMLGLSSKKKLSITLPADVDADIFKTGIDKLSNNKAFTDEAFIIYQLLQYVPLSFLEKTLDSSPKEIIELFEADEAAKQLIPALILSAVNFSDKQWALHLMQFCSVFYIDLIPLLPAEQQEYYSIKFFKGNEQAVLSHAVNKDAEWSRELALNIISYTANHPYQYNKVFYENIIQKIPAAITAHLSNYGPNEKSYERQYWETTKTYLEKILLLKATIKKDFLQA